ncbi:putative LRR containing protein [Trachipleistophora hominis]|uniref:Putative LRR containing protein n=1 Tax=Trachipleistophora hominis TaxID=72359 RepID=L7JV80_TRAHO|nr:putative LRR containing protein [Trachipleistophora hominis]
MENATNQGEFKLNVATINKILNMNENVSDVAFTHVKVSTGSYVTFNEKIKQLSIKFSEGLFNLEPYIGQKYRFNKKIAIEILPVENSVANLSKIMMRNFKFTERVKLSDNYERVELNHVHTTGDGEIILNKACKKLNICECSVVINARNVKDLKLLYIQFSITEKNNIKFIGLTSVNHMCLTNICQCVDSIITMLTDRCEIKHLTFENKYAYETSELFSEYYSGMLRRLIYQEKYQSNLSAKLKCLVAKDVNSSVFMYTVPNAVVNFILHEILGKGGMTTVSKLEFISVAIDVNSCMMLRKLQNLTILRICLANITSRFIYNLPTNLKLLDITDFSSENVSWATKYAIKPAVIIRSQKRLEVLIVDLQFLYNFSAISMRFPHLKVLKVRYSQSTIIHSRMQGNKMNVYELLIEYNADQVEAYQISAISPEMVYLLENLKLYVDFDSLDCLAFVSENKSVVIDPKTFKAKVFG